MHAVCSVKFIARKQWFICAAKTEGLAHVYSYETQEMQKVNSFRTQEMQKVNSFRADERGPPHMASRSSIPALCDVVVSLRQRDNEAMELGQRMGVHTHIPN
jgi:hypothetical protein